jgi:hypothetical protein
LTSRRGCEVPPLAVERARALSAPSIRRSMRTEDELHPDRLRAGPAAPDPAEEGREAGRSRSARASSSMSSSVSVGRKVVPKKVNSRRGTSSSIHGLPFHAQVRDERGTARSARRPRGAGATTTCPSLGLGRIHRREPSSLSVGEDAARVRWRGHLRFGGSGARRRRRGVVGRRRVHRPLRGLRVGRAFVPLQRDHVRRHHFDVSSGLSRLAPVAASPSRGRPRRSSCGSRPSVPPWIQASSVRLGPITAAAVRAAWQAHSSSRRPPSRSRIAAGSAASASSCSGVGDRRRLGAACAAWCAATSAVVLGDVAAVLAQHPGTLK